MQLYPAIDIRGGRCVRLTQGEFSQEKVYSSHPADVAKTWNDQGATYLHVVDLDGALAGRSVNESVIRAITEAVDIPVELGGGIRTMEGARRMLELGVARVIIGTKAAQRPEFMGELVQTFGPERIVAGVDAKNGQVAVAGWEQLSSMTALELCLRMKDMGIRHIVYTDIARDGMLSGPNVEGVSRLTKETGLDIIASGGVSSIEDLRNLSQAGIQGAIIGKALYENRISLKEAVLEFEIRAKDGRSYDR